ncbi:MAG: hypothetical protein OXB95_06845 [Rhodobacteraceae bacterium]|nr:hypothetical protein [Paracoccaceae bacterium]
MDLWLQGGFECNGIRCGCVGSRDARATACTRPVRVAVLLAEELLHCRQRDMTISIDRFRNETIPLERIQPRRGEAAKAVAVLRQRRLATVNSTKGLAAVWKALRAQAFPDNSDDD